MGVTQLDEWFTELMHALDHQSVFINKGDDPVFFLVYPPAESLRVYQLLPEWIGKLKYRGWVPHVFNVGLALVEYIRAHADYETLSDFARDNPEELEQVNESVSDMLRKSDDSTVVEDMVAEQIATASANAKGLLILTGVELLHPYLQIGRIEQRLQGRFTVPTIVLYPGTRTSTFGLRFLGFYPPDGNYRSRHFGGTYA